MAACCGAERATAFCPDRGERLLAGARGGVGRAHKAVALSDGMTHTTAEGA